MRIEKAPLKSNCFASPMRTKYPVFHLTMEYHLECVLWHIYQFFGNRSIRQRDLSDDRGIIGINIRSPNHRKSFFIKTKSSRNITNCCSSPPKITNVLISASYVGKENSSIESYVCWSGVRCQRLSTFAWYSSTMARSETPVQAPAQLYRLPHWSGLEIHFHVIMSVQFTTLRRSVWQYPFGRRTSVDNAGIGDGTPNCIFQLSSHSNDDHTRWLVHKSNDIVPPTSLGSENVLRITFITHR